MRDKKVWFSLITLLVLMAGLFGGCAGEEAPTAPTPTGGEFKMPDPVKIVTDGIGTSSYTLLCGMAPIMEKYWGVKVRVTPMEAVRDKYQPGFDAFFGTVANTSRQ